jgi:CheY-like chemotaxis protein
MDDDTRTILVVEDDEDLRRSYAEALGGRGFRIIAAGSGDEAVERVTIEGVPDLVVTDGVMPGMDGFEMLSRLSRLLGPSMPPAIVCSGFEMTEQEALRRGAVMFLHKPVDSEALVWAVDLVLDGACLGSASPQTNRTRAAAARRSVKLLADAAARKIDRVALAEQGRRTLSWLCSYFGCGSAAVLLPDAGGLEPFLLYGAPLLGRDYQDLGALADPLRAVVETGTALLVGDLATDASFGSGGTDGGGQTARFLVGVPVSASRARPPVAVMCLADAAPRRFEAEDLGILEHFARRSGFLVDGGPTAGDGVVDEARTLAASSFGRVLGLELGLAHKLGAQLELALLEVDAPADLGQAAAAASRLMGPRAALGRLGPSRLGFLARSVAEIGSGAGADPV